MSLGQRREERRQAGVPLQAVRRREVTDAAEVYYGDRGDTSTIEDTVIAAQGFWERAKIKASEHAARATLAYQFCHALE